MKRLALLALLATACGEDPTAPELRASSRAAEGVPGHVDLAPCWPNPDTAWMVNLPVCPPESR